MLSFFVRWRRDRRGLAGTLQGIGDEAVGFHLFNKLPQVTEAGRSAFRCADRLLDFLKRIRHDPRIGVALGINVERFAYTCCCIKMLVEERFDAARGAALRIADQDRVFQRAGQIKIIDRAEADADLAARSIDCRTRYVPWMSR